MPINFFQVACKTQSKEVSFGLCDKPPPAKDPAYIDEHNTADWIATVNNPTEKIVDFYAVDHCVTIVRPNGEEESRCDGFLHHDNNLAFVELKDRASSGWLVKGLNQLTTTLQIFEANHDLTAFDKIEVIVANKQRPFSNSGMQAELEKFKDNTGLVFEVKATITI
jgi:hypothetical protein